MSNLRLKIFIFFNAFPPFPLIGRVLKKIIEEQAIGIVVVPYWPNHSWFSLFLRLCCHNPKIFKPFKNLLCSPFRKPHQLWKNIRLAASILSGEPFLEKGITPDSVSVILNSISNSTLRQYFNTYKKWWQFCQMHQLNIYNVSVNKIISFLYDLYVLNLSYVTQHTQVRTIVDIKYFKQR